MLFYSREKQSKKKSKVNVIEVDLGICFISPFYLVDDLYLASFPPVIIMPMLANVLWKDTCVQSPEMSYFNTILSQSYDSLQLSYSV